MKRIVFSAPRTVELEDVPVPKPGPGRILVKVDVSGISAGTEMSYYRGAPDIRLAKEEYTYPILPGYETVGTVAECGDGVTHFKQGDRVVCLGFHAEYVEVDAALSAQLPESLSDECATLAVLTVTSMHAVRRAAIEYGDTVVVVGLGVVGLLAAQQAKLAGASQVVGVDISTGRLQKALTLGIDRVVDASSELAKDEVADAAGGLGADVVIEATGAAQAFEDALHYARDRGRVVILGYHTAPVQFVPGEEFYHKELEIRATRAVGPHPGLPPAYVRWTSDRSLKLAVDLLAKGRLQVSGMITHRFHYTEARDVYALIDQQREDFLQVLLLWGDPL